MVKNLHEKWTYGNGVTAPHMLILLVTWYVVIALRFGLLFKKKTGHVIDCYVPFANYGKPLLCFIYSLLYAHVVGGGAGHGPVVISLNHYYDGVSTENWGTYTRGKDGSAN